MDSEEMGETVHGLSFPALPILRGGSDISPVVSPPKPDSSASLIREADMKALPAPPLPALATQGLTFPAPEEASLYDLLGVAPTATTEQIRAAYLEQVRSPPLPVSLADSTTQKSASDVFPPRRAHDRLSVRIRIESRRGRRKRRRGSFKRSRGRT